MDSCIMPKISVLHIPDQSMDRVIEISRFKLYDVTSLHTLMILYQVHVISFLIGNWF